MRQAFVTVVDVDQCTFDHIGSTAVAGFDAKPYGDLQAVLTPVGWVPAPGSRPGFPGVLRDKPGPGDDEPDWVWATRLFVATDPACPAILHARLTASPFGRRTVAFRDRLRADPQLAADYQRLKPQLAAAHASDAYYNDYTRARGPSFAQRCLADRPAPAQ